MNDFCRGAFHVRDRKEKKNRPKGGTLTEVFTRDIEGNPFEKGFSLKLPS